MSTTHPNKRETEEILGIQGYKYLDYQNGWKHVYFDENHQVTDDPDKRKSFGYRTEDYPEYGKCRDSKHKPKEKQHNNRGSNVTYWCDECRIFWKVDMSD